MAIVGEHGTRRRQCAVGGVGDGVRAAVELGQNDRTRSMRNCAHAVGVLVAVWATWSATLRSLSWPMPVITGSGHSAMALATRSWSNVARSLLLPPRTTMR